jgi:hypothetical protein
VKVRDLGYRAICRLALKYFTFVECIHHRQLTVKEPEKDPFFLKHLVLDTFEGTSLHYM